MANNHRKMLNLISDKRNRNQNHKERPLSTFKMHETKESDNTKCW